MDLETFSKSRGFTVAELEKFKIRVEDDTVIIPLLGKHGAWYERSHHPNQTPKYRSPKGVEPHLYNPAGLGPGSREVWIAEGEFDTLSLLTVGAPAVGILGKDSFRREWSYLFQGCKVVIAIDPDAEDRVTTLAALFEPAMVSRFNPSPHDDLNDWFKQDRQAFMLAVMEHE